MTVSTLTIRDDYDGDGSSVVFNITFPFFSASEIEVIVRTNLTGIESVKTLTTDYSVTGGGTDIPANGSITMIVPPLGSGLESITIRRVTDRLQDVDLTRGGPLPPNSVEGALDRHTLLDQEDFERLDRALVIARTDDATLDMEIPNSVDRASNFLAFNASGEPIASAGSTPATVTVSTWMSTNLLDDTSALEARTTLDALEDPLVARGDLIVADASIDAVALTIGTANQVLQSDGTDPAWVDPTVARILTPGHLNGCTLSPDAVEPLNDLNVTAGMARDSTDAANIDLTSEITKRVDEIWVVGDDGGGMPDTLLAVDTWYHVFLIRNPTSGLVDVGFDTSLTAANLIVDHTGASGGDASGYTEFRRIGSILTNGSSQIIDFFQWGDRFLLDTPVDDYNATPADTNAIDQEITTPLGVRCLAMMNVSVSSGNQGGLYVSSLDSANIIPSLSAAPGATVSGRVTSTGAATNFTYVEVQTNLLSEVRFRVSTTDLVQLYTLGWIDRRGRDD